MGQLTLFFVMAAFLVSGIVVYNASRSADRADEKVWEHQYRVLAKDAAATGMATTVRKLGETTNTGFVTHPDYPFTATDVAYDGGTYDVQTFHNSCSILSPANRDSVLAPFAPIEEMIEIRSTGTYASSIGQSTQNRHQIRGCYIRSDWGLFAPPAFNYGFISDGDATFNGGTATSLVEGEGHIHTNSGLTVRPNTTIQGVLTYTGTANVHQNADTGEVSQAAQVPLPPFSASDFASAQNIPTACGNPDVCLYGMPDLGDTSHPNVGVVNGNPSIIPPTSDVGHRQDNPFIWYIPGNLTLSGGTHLVLPQYTIIVVDGNVVLSGGSSITVTGVKAPTSGTPEQQQAWVQSQLLDGEHSPLAFYGTGDVTISGSASVVGNFYVNGDVTLNGGGQGMNSVGSFAAGGTMTVNGGGGATKTNFWFTSVAEETVIDGVMLPGKRIVRIATSEWTEPVLANAQ